MLFFYSGISKEGKGWEIFHSIQGFMNPKYLYLSLVMKTWVYKDFTHAVGLPLQTSNFYKYSTHFRGL